MGKGREWDQWKTREIGKEDNCKKELYILITGK
jgi:hypothetical protein